MRKESYKLFADTTVVNGVPVMSGRINEFKVLVVMPNTLSHALRHAPKDGSL